jgi:hypothetical protein
MKPIKNCYKFYEYDFSYDDRLKFLNEINFSNIEDETIEDKQTNTAKRKVKKISVQNDNWFVKKIRSYTKKANDELWNFDLNFDQIEKNTLDANEILMYDEQSFYEYHTDHTSISSKLDLKIHRIDNNVYHFEHSRTEFSDCSHKNFINNQRLYDHIKSMSKEECSNQR